MKIKTIVTNTWTILNSKPLYHYYVIRKTSKFIIQIIF